MIRKVFEVFDMFGFKAGADIRLGSILPLIETSPSSRTQVDTALDFIIRSEWIVPSKESGGYTLTSEGEEAKKAFLT